MHSAAWPGRVDVASQDPDSSVRSSGVVPMANIVSADSMVESPGCLFLGARKPRVSIPLCGSRFFFFFFFVAGDPESQAHCVGG